MSVQTVVVAAVAVQVSDPAADTVQTVALGDMPVQASVPAVSSVQLSPRTLPKQLIVAKPVTDPIPANIAYAVASTDACATTDPAPASSL